MLPNKPVVLLAQLPPKATRIPLSGGGHPLGIRFKDERTHDRFRGLLTFRNNSILAHGWQPIGKKPAADFLALAEVFLREYSRSFSVDFDYQLARVQHPHVESAETNI
jgi:hypothetical protein